MKWELYMHPAAEFYASGTGFFSYFLVLRFFPSTGTIICSVEPPHTFSDEAKAENEHNEFRHVAKVLGMLEWA